MNKTRKAIIELIEPYMDKTLSEGCFMFYENKAFCKIKNLWRNSICDVQYYINSLEIYTNKCNLKEEDFNINYKIIGYYDITSVLKFFSYFDFQIENIDFLKDIIYIYNKNNMDEIYYFPNKPLHLYTEEEDKQLLDLLLKLKQYE